MIHIFFSSFYINFSIILFLNLIFLQNLSLLTTYKGQDFVAFDLIYLILFVRVEINLLRAIQMISLYH